MALLNRVLKPCGGQAHFSLNRHIDRNRQIAMVASISYDQSIDLDNCLLISMQNSIKVGLQFAEI